MRTAILVILALGIAFGAGIATGHNHARVVYKTTDQVESFNDGFLTGKSDCPKH
jgi:hypothetical protein